MSDVVIDLERFVPFVARSGHSGWTGIRHRAHGPDWVELDLPFAARLVGDAACGTIATGAVFTLMDVATTCAIWLRIGRFEPHATLDLRLDHLRAPTPGAALIGRGECHRVAGSIAFVRGIAHEGDAGDPVAQATGSYMFTGAMPAVAHG